MKSPLIASVRQVGKLGSNLGGGILGALWPYFW